MTMQPVGLPRPLTVADYLAIGEVTPGRTELVEGRLALSASPPTDHRAAQVALRQAVRQQLPPHLVAERDVGLDLQFAPAGGAGTVLRPDLTITSGAAGHRVQQEGGVLQASEVLVVAEIVCPGSVRTDHRVKRAEYADAGIPHYWIVDLDDPIALTACHLVGDGYRDAGAVTGRFATTEPFPVEIDLAALAG